MRSSHLVSLILSILFLVGVQRSDAAINLALGSEWKESISQLHTLPVQDTGAVRTGYSFAENYISAVTGKRQVGGADAVETILCLLRNDQDRMNAPIIKISHPELVKVYGTARITVNQWRDMAYREQLLAFLAIDKEARLSPLNSIEYQAQLLEGIEGEFAIVPRMGEWAAPAAAMAAGNISPLDARIIEQWNALKAAVVADDATAGANASRELVQAVTAAAEQLDGGLPPLGLEIFYYTHAPFRNAAVLYLFSAVAFAGGLVLAKAWLGWVGFGLLAVGFVEHSLGFGTRWIISQRGPFSNMYESFIFAIGGMVLVALILEGSRMVRLAGLGASVLGFIFMVLAHKLPIFDSQIKPLVPALQSSWLTYHVVTIMLSYSAFALSCFIAAIYLVKDKFLGGDLGTSLIARRLPSMRAMDVFNYRIIAVGFPLLTIGIIAGAVWAATAWGRPWGFDPKETWSAITWLIYAIYLHVRFMAGWSGRSAAVISIVGFLAVLFTYFGVNYLLPGLHSYV